MGWKIFRLVHINHVDKANMSSVGRVGMNTVAEIVEKLGGGANVARILSVGPSTASEMKRRGSIPPAYWPTILASEKGREIGLTAEILMFAHARKVAAE
jgi:hypothetical protein